MISAPAKIAALDGRARIWQAVSGRRLALLGGTTTLGDCLVALRYLVSPRRLVHGSAIARYERAFAAAIGVRYAASFAHGRIGFYGLLRALDIGPGDEVLLQAPTHIVVANAIRYVGARPVYVDCQLDTYNINLDAAERLITPRTRALLVQHTFGVPVDLDAALALARRHDLAVIEDCVHALGATYDGRPVGSFGHAAFFSSEETKTISTTMGGVAVTDDPEIAARLRAFQGSCHWPRRALVIRYLLKLALYHVLTEPRLFRFMRALYERLGKRSPLPRPTSGDEARGGKPERYEQRLSNAQAALGLRQLRRLPANVAHRRAVADAYARQLAGMGARVPLPPAKAVPAYVRFPVWVTDRAAALRTAAPHALLGTWFTSVLEESETPEAGGYARGSCPNAEAAAIHLVNLPTNPRVRPRDAHALVVALSCVVGKAGMGRDAGG